MKPLLACAASVLLLHSPLAAAPNTLDEIHSLTSADGKEIKAQIVRMSDTEVKIRKGRKEFDVPLSKFSKDSQDYLLKWAKENVKFDVEVERSPVKLTGIGKMASWGYEVTLESRSGINAENLKLVYRIYNSVGRMATRRIKVKKITADEKIKFKTVAGSETFGGRLIAGAEEGGGGTSGNNLAGLWIRIYDSSGKKIFEDKKVTTKIKDEWPD